MPGSDKTQRNEPNAQFSNALITDCTAVTFNQAEKVNLGQEIVSGLKWLVINLDTSDINF